MSLKNYFRIIKNIEEDILKMRYRIEELDNEIKVLKNIVEDMKER